MTVATAGFWAIHAGHAAVVVVPATAMGAALWRTGTARRADAARIDALRGSVHADGPWNGVASHPRSWARHATVVSAMGAVTAALLHLVVMPSHFGESWLYGAFFLGCAATQMAWAAAVLRRPESRLLTAGLVGSALVVGLWLATRSTALAPLGREDVGAYDLMATAAELVCCAGAALALRAARHGRGVAPGPVRSWARPVQGASLAMVALTVAVAAFVPVR